MTDQGHPSRPPLSTPNVDFSRRVFLVTGGTQGIGLAVARMLKDKGAAGIVLVSRSEDKGQAAVAELNDDSCQCAYVCADLSSAEGASSTVTRSIDIMKDVGPLSGVVNCAAITERGNLFTETAEGFDRQFALNVRTPFLITQGAATHMINQGIRGSIVNICSCASYGGAPFIMAYSASKAALVNLTKNNAAELAPKGVRVNGINMGWCLTENEDKLQRRQSGSDWLERADDSVPLGRILRPEDVAATVVFLLSDAAAMMTGSIVELHPEFPHGMISLADEDAR